jgi:hypothetical protein
VATASETEGTLSIAADWRVEHDNGAPALVVTLDLGDLTDIAGISWQFDAVLDIGSETGTDLTLRYIPNGDDED